MLIRKQVGLVMREKPVYIFLLPVFFVLHGYISNYNSIPVGGALLLTLLYIGCILIITGFAWFFYRSLVKASLAAFFIIAFHLFFGVMQDILKRIFGDLFISQYRFIIPVSIFFFTVMIIWLKKRKNDLRSLQYYLNALLAILILIDIGRLITKTVNSKDNLLSSGLTQAVVKCDSCKKPDIYLILLDQYAGREALMDVFNFDNSAFENELKTRGFHVAANSRSNYNLTPFSMASTLNMNYLSAEMGVKKNLNVGYSYESIRNSSVVKFLTGDGYRFYNYSVFDVPGQPAHQYGAFLPYGIKLITTQTLTGRLARDIRSAILEGKLPFKGVQNTIAYEYLHFNEGIAELTKTTAASKASAPKFVYAHFIMPHYPYYFDSKGTPVALEKLTGFRKTNTDDYIGYLQYGNHKVLQLVDSILIASPQPPVIMLLSDHGFRHPAKKTERRYDFMNLNAIYLPDKNYSRFDDSITNVNHFRVFFNSCFGQHFSLLKDSTIDLWD